MTQDTRCECGTEMRLDSGRKMLYCPKCGRKVPVPKDDPKTGTK